MIDRVQHIARSKDNTRIVFFPDRFGEERVMFLADDNGAILPKMMINVHQYSHEDDNKYFNFEIVEVSCYRDQTSYVKYGRFVIKVNNGKYIMFTGEETGNGEIRWRDSDWYYVTPKVTTEWEIV